jgi:hypothetical protein
VPSVADRGQRRKARNELCATTARVSQAERGEARAEDLKHDMDAEPEFLQAACSQRKGVRPEWRLLKEFLTANGRE